MVKSIDLLQLCRGLSQTNKKAQMLFVDNINHNTMHQISEIFYNIQFLTEYAPPKLKKKIICGMRKNRVECIYISNRQSRYITKKNLKKQIGTGLFSLLLSTAIPILSSIIGI